MTALDDRLRECILSGKWFSANEVTDNGAITLDPDHAPNGKQSGIGAYFNTHAGLGHIVTDHVTVLSKAPHRRGGRILRWKGTAKGRRWAAS